MEDGEREWWEDGIRSVLRVEEEDVSACVCVCGRDYSDCVCRGVS